MILLLDTETAKSGKYWWEAHEWATGKHNRISSADHRIFTELCQKSQDTSLASCCKFWAILYFSKR